MAEAYVTYDLVNGKGDTEVKDGMKELGYSDSWTITDLSGKKVYYYLPNTCLWKSKTTVEQGKTDLLKVARECKAEVERLIVTDCTSWTGIEGKAYKS